LPTGPVPPRASSSSLMANACAALTKAAR
jgi:hypothetical protein